ncbi:hypothetical protein Avbf_12937 [Armadillidium vulgare]|nr:hypothetical protein Avbf_12937 [Armadillidium vulgare]
MVLYRNLFSIKKIKICFQVKDFFKQSYHSVKYVVIRISVHLEALLQRMPAGYKCEAVNSVGTATSIAEVIVNDKVQFEEIHDDEDDDDFHILDEYESSTPDDLMESIAVVETFQERPLLTALQNQITVFQGQDIDLRCEPSGINPASVQWSFEGQGLPRNAYPLPSESALRFMIQFSTFLIYFNCY